MIDIVDSYYHIEIKIIIESNLFKNKIYFTCGILNNFSKLATWMEVTLEAAATTPEITLFWISGCEPSSHRYDWSSSILLIEPKKFKKYAMWENFDALGKSSTECIAQD